MSLIDIVPIVLQTKIKRRPMDRAEIQRRWQLKNREHLRRYKRAWDAKRKAG